MYTLFILSIALTLSIFILYLIRERQYRQLKFLYDRTSDINNIMMKVSKELNNFYDINDLYQQLLEDTVKLVNSGDNGSILIYNKDNNAMEYVAAVGFDLKELKDIRLTKEELFLYKTTMLKIADIIKNPVVYDSQNIDKVNFDKLKASNSLDIKATISSPLYINGEFYGVINIDNNSNAEAFDKRDLRLIEYICRQLEIAIKNVLLMNQLIEALRVDKLTDIYNRRHFEDLMEVEIKKSERYKTKLALVMIDLDNFKAINDTFGHGVGDKVLRYFASVLKHSVRDTDIVARYAGDEFVLVLFQSNEEDTRNRIEQVRKYIRENPFGENIDVKFSAGVACYTHGISLDRLITLADNNMYSEKRGNKNLSCL